MSEAFIFSFPFDVHGTGLCETFGMSTQKMGEHLAQITQRCRAEAVGNKADVASIMVAMLREGALPGAVLMVLASVAMKEILEETPGEIDLQRRAKG